MKRILFFAVLPMYINAVIPELEIWRKGDVYRYFFKDVHADYLDATRTLAQHKDIVDVARQVGRDGFVLTEDVISQIAPKGTSLDCHIRQLQQHYKGLWADPKITQIFEFSPLSLLKSTCREYGIKSYNIECQASVLKYSFLRKNMTNEQHLSQQQVIINKFSSYLEKIKKNEFYNKASEELTRLKSISSEDEESFLRQAYNVRFFLLEARLLHKLALLEEHKHGFICVGNTHIERIKPELSTMGYSHVKTIGVSVMQVLGLVAQDVAGQGIVEETSDVYQKVIDSKMLSAQSSESMQDKIAALVNSSLNIRTVMEQVFKEQQ